MRNFGLVLLTALALAAQKPGPIAGGYDLPNGWRITPAGKSIPTEDMILNIVTAPDGKALIALHGGYNPHGLLVLDPAGEKVVQQIRLKSAWLGLAWSPDGTKLYASGGNASARTEQQATKAPVYVFGYNGGKLTDQPVATLDESIPHDKIYWSGIAHHPKKNILFAANRGTGPETGSVVVFDTTERQLVKRIPVEVNPYDAVLSPDALKLYVSNWASDSISVIDTETMEVENTLHACDNPNDLAMSKDGRLFVACANENTVVAIDTKKGQGREKIVTAMHAQAPHGTTPNALALSPDEKTLFVANADNNNVAVVDISEPGHSNVAGFVPAGWYPSSVATDGKKLYVGNAKGLGGYSNIRGPHSPLPPGDEGKGTVKTLMKGSLQIVQLPQVRTQLRKLTEQSIANSPYRDEYLMKAKAPANPPKVIPTRVGTSSPIKHILYVIKENRTYDQVFGDFPQGNGDPRLTIFGRRVTPNHHAIAEQFVLFDNLYCDGEVSVDGHSWSNAAYATDFNEKYWPVTYGGHSRVQRSQAFIPSTGFIWDQCARKGLTYRSYGEFATRTSENDRMEGVMTALVGHTAPNFKKPGMRDTDNAREFIREFDEFEKNYDSTDPRKRLPNFMVMSLGENHTQGTRPGVPTPTAAVASNDYGLGMIVERITSSRYWPETAIFVIEDDAQDGSDHVDARRTVGLVISPYTKRKFVDSTLYTTSAMLRTIELILGLRPMSQYDAAAMPMYNAFTDNRDVTAFKHLPPQVDINQLNAANAWGAQASLAMDFSDYDRTPMFELNEIVWKSVRGPDSRMPLPVRRHHFVRR